MTVLSTFGHCGTDWLHSLIDSHKEVLIIPRLSFFRKLDVLKKRKIDLEDSLSAKQIIKIFINEYLGQGIEFGKSHHEKDNILKKIKVYPNLKNT